MIKIPIYLLVLLQWCFLNNLYAQNIINLEFTIKNQLEEAIKHPLSKYSLEPVENLKISTLRVWRFPGGGAIFEQMVELRQSEFTFYSYLLEDVEEKAEYSDLNFVMEVKDRKIRRRLKSIITNPEFLNTLDSENYCGPHWGCGDLFYVQYTNGDEVVKFIVDHKIENCDNLEAEIAKNLLGIIKTFTNKY